MYTQRIDGRACYYGDDTNLEVYIVINTLDKYWAAVEVELGGGPAITKAIQSLRALRSRVDTEQQSDQARFMVFTAFGHGYQTDDGIAIVPLTALKP